ncbi:MAG: CoA transferase, partial [Roseibium sp.]
AIVAGETLDHWLTVFDGVDACVSPVLSVEEAARDAGGTGRGSWVRDTLSFQPFPAPRFSRSPVRQPSPTLENAGLDEVLHAWRTETET